MSVYAVFPASGILIVGSSDSPSRIQCDPSAPMRSPFSICVALKHETSESRASEILTEPIKYDLLESLRDFRTKPAIVLTLLLLLNCNLSLGEDSARFSSEWGIIRTGAFVIPSAGQNWDDSEGRATGKRIGYLRIGTLVKVGSCRYVTGPPGAGGNYCDVRSEHGVEGKAKIDQIFPMDRGKVYAVARREIDLYDRNDWTQKRDKFSRTAGTIIEITGDYTIRDKDVNIDVIAIYNIEKSGALTNLSIRTQDLIEKCYVVDYPRDRDVPPTKLSAIYTQQGSVLAGTPVNIWSYDRVHQESADQLANQVARELGFHSLPLDDARASIQQAFHFASGVLDRIFCVAQIDADVQTGFDFFGNRFGFSGSLPIYETGKLYDFDADVLKADGQVKFAVFVMKTVVCDQGATPIDSVPRAIEAVTIRIFRGTESEGEGLRFTATMAQRMGLTISEAVDSGGVARLFELDGFQSYSDAIRLINHRIAQTSVVDNLDRKERSTLAHYLISKLAYFVRPSPDLD